MHPDLQTYQLYLQLLMPVSMTVGSRGMLFFKPGFYIYTGSARKNLVSRVSRHLSRNKKMHWHIDYLLSHPDAQVRDVRFYRMPECELNQVTDGEFPLPGFGASDCVSGCASHLCFQGNRIVYPGVY